MLIIPQLRPLLDDMTTKDEQRCIFRYQRQQVIFSVVFIRETDDKDNPLALIFGHAGPPPFAFMFYGTHDLEFSTFLEPEEYRRLCKLLDLKYDANNPFSPTTFLANFAGSNQIPEVVGNGMIPSPDQVPAPARFVSDADRPYFLNWKNLPQEQNVSLKNYRRTLFAFGRQTADLLKDQKISSCWTAKLPDNNPDRFRTPL